MDLFTKAKPVSYLIQGEFGPESRYALLDYILVL